MGHDHEQRELTGARSFSFTPVGARSGSPQSEDHIYMFVASTQTSQAAAIAPDTLSWISVHLPVSDQPPGRHSNSATATVQHILYARSLSIAWNCLPGTVFTSITETQRPRIL
ncbi:hypothetical protein ON010_g109 [Phytophthora cinnamomi]|nr:hypothetical protein ON010_g109 [Phytophthora cinnamomi]